MIRNTGPLLKKNVVMSISTKTEDIHPAWHFGKNHPRTLPSTECSPPVSLQGPADKGGKELPLFLLQSHLPVGFEGGKGTEHC